MKLLENQVRSLFKNYSAKLVLQAVAKELEYLGGKMPETWQRESLYEMASQIDDVWYQSIEQYRNVEEVEDKVNNKIKELAAWFSDGPVQED